MRGDRSATHAGERSPLHNADGEVLGCVITMADYTDRKAAEEALKQADRRKDEFLATLSHELRNPLAPVRNAVNIMKLRSPDEPELIWAREIIERQVHQLTRLIDDLLDVSRITRDHLELRKSGWSCRGYCRRRWKSAGR